MDDILRIITRRLSSVGVRPGFSMLLVGLSVLSSDEIVCEWLRSSLVRRCKRFVVVVRVRTRGDA